MFQRLNLKEPTLKHSIRRLNTSPNSSSASLKRSYLYVPSSSDRMLEKSLSTNSDTIIYDLEDSVPPSAADKTASRKRLSDFLRRGDLPSRERVAVRVNDISTPFFLDDISKIVASKSVGSLVLPKVHSAEDLHTVSRAIHDANTTSNTLGLVASIESARASYNLGAIASWTSEFGRVGGTLTGLLFAAEDYCADTSILRSSSRRELLYTRSSIVITAKAFGLEAIDMVCVNYKDLDFLREECRDGRQLGFTGKQAIHPTQVDVIQSTFVPTASEIERAAKILHTMEREHALNRGAAGLEGEMIDKPMILQAEKILRIARAANLEIPRIT
ncbi:Pyruvate/Phosphoenolpyruvate kinase-like domain-containing protein [Mycena metata]|uniref:Pyruvate/Phosphoenolpyruvate kinase-like domain-containing protein n=1 Tax=Mycena metata TaxID=1033252 RepID=A0AAD7MDM3_9AGAR|nr:Pyruvate/Phosphoenolpyruvate kinase-like domain-containing protein [Mycena metata]